MTDGNNHFWKIAEDFLGRPGCERATMMDFPCLRRDGAFFGCIHKDGSTLIVKMSKAAVSAMVASGDAMPFAPNGRTFKEWAAVPTDMHETWKHHLETAWEFAGKTK